MSANTNKLVKHTVWTTLDSIFSFLGGAILSILVARLYGPSIMGYYSYVWWIVVVTSTLAGHGGMVLVIRRYLMEHLESGDVTTAKAIMLFLTNIQIGITMIAFVIGLGVMLLTLPPEHYGLGSLGAVIIIPMLMSAPFAGANSALEHLMPNIKASVIGTGINFAGAAITIASKGAIKYLLVSFLIGRLVSFFLVYYYYKKHFDRYVWRDRSKKNIVAENIISKNLRRRILKYTVSTTLLQGLNLLVWDRSEIFVLKAWRKIEEVAYYSLPFSLISQTGVAYRSFTSVSGIHLMRRHVSDAEGAAQMTTTLFRYTALIAFPASFGLAILSAPLITLLYGEKYLEAVPVLFVLGVLGYGRALLLPIEQYLAAAERQDLMVKGMLLSGILNLALAFALIPRHGALGAAVCNGMSQLCAAFICWKILISHSPQIIIPFRALGATLLSSVLMLCAISPLVLFLKPVYALPSGIIVGCLCYVFCIRLFKVLSAEDKLRFEAIGANLPKIMRSVVGRIVRFFYY